MSDHHPSEPEKLDLASLDIAAQKRDELARIFPEVRTEGGKIDFDRLKAALGEAVDSGRERYGMTWPGKAECMRTIQAPSMGTLLPMREESVDWDTTANVIIEGDNLEVLKLLQKSYLGKIKMIYIDPPYNTGKDFIYPDNFTESLQTYLEYTGQADSDGRKFGPNADSDGRYHSRWLNMMYPRLFLAKNLLKDDGVIFVSIDDYEGQNLVRLCSDIFGEENFLGFLPTVMNLKGNNDEFGFAGTHEYTVVFAKNKDRVALYEFPIDEEDEDDWEEDELGFFKRGANLKATGKNAPREKRPNLYFPIYVHDGRVFLERQSSADVEMYPLTDGQEMSWRWSKAKFQKQQSDVIVVGEAGSYSIYKKQRPSLGDLPSKKPKSLLYKPEYSSGNGTAAIKRLCGAQLFSSPPKPPALIEDFVRIGSQPGDIVLDFFAGSGTTGQSILELNSEAEADRSFILVQLPEALDPDKPDQRAGAQFCDSIGKPRTIAEITKERVRRVISGLPKQESLLTSEPRDRGFRSYKLAASNFIPWDGTASNDADQLINQLQLAIEHTRDDRTPEDLLHEVLLKSWGEPALSLKVSEELIDGIRVFSIADGAFLICLEEEVTLKLVRAIAARKPDRVVMRESAFAANDQLKANAVQTFKTHGVTSFKVV